MKKLTILFLVFTLIFTLNISIKINAQQQGSVQSDPDVEKGELLTDIIVSKFEDAEAWSGQMPLDQGSILLMKRLGKPAALPDKDPVTGIENKFVLGVKVQFNKRGSNRFIVKPPKPIKIVGITKTLSIWVVGRNFSHTLYYMISDFFNRPINIKATSLNFLGWKKITTIVPPDIVQDEYHYVQNEGITFLGLLVETNPAESYGTYYIYFDELTARSNVFTQSNVDMDDMVDTW